MLSRPVRILATNYLSHLPSHPSYQICAINSCHKFRTRLSTLIKEKFFLTVLNIAITVCTFKIPFNFYLFLLFFVLTFLSFNDGKRKPLFNLSFIKSCLIYRYLVEKYYRKTMDMNQIIFRLNDGLVDRLFKAN